MVSRVGSRVSTHFDGTTYIVLPSVKALISEYNPYLTQFCKVMLDIKFTFEKKNVNFFRIHSLIVIINEKWFFIECDYS